MNLTDILSLDDEELTTALLVWYKDICEYFSENQSIIKTVFPLEDIEIVQISLLQIENQIKESLDIPLDEMLQGGTELPVEIPLTFKLNTPDLKGLGKLVTVQGITLLRGLELLKSILVEAFNINNANISIHIDSLIDVKTANKEVEAYYLQINLYKV